MYLKTVLHISSWASTWECSVYIEGVGGTGGWWRGRDEIGLLSIPTRGSTLEGERGCGPPANIQHVHSRYHPLSVHTVGCVGERTLWYSDPVMYVRSTWLLNELRVLMIMWKLVRFLYKKWCFKIKCWRQCCVTCEMDY